MTYAFFRTALVAVASLSLGATLLAQDPDPLPDLSQPLPDLSQPLPDLSAEIPGLTDTPMLAPATPQQGGAEPSLTTRFPGVMSGHDTTTSRFSPAFNPAMALVFDTVASASQDNVASNPEADGLSIRSVEIDLASRIDPMGWAYMVASFEDGSFSLEEAAFFMDRLPANMSLRVGQFLSDFDKWNTVHQHDLNYVFEDGVREAFFGGNLRMTGVELHQFTGIGELPVRWSLGVGSDFRGQKVEGDGSPVNGHNQDFLSGAAGNRGFRQYGYTARVTAQQDVDTNGFLQYGVSLFHTPDGLIDNIDTNLDGVADVSQGRSQNTGVLELTYRNLDPSSRSSNTWTVEYWRNRRETLSGAGPAFASTNHDANAIWGFYQHDFSPYWAVGAQAAWWQSAVNTTGSDFLGGGQAGAQRAAYVTWHPSIFNRLRLQLGQTTPTVGAPVWSLSLQWDVILGAHSHPLDW